MHLKDLTSRRIVLIIELGLMFLGVLTAFLYYSHYGKLLGNSSSRFLLVLGPHLGIGRPYTDLWEFVPPGFLMIANFWVTFFGWSMASFKALQILLLLAAGLLFLFILKKIIKNEITELILYSTFAIIFYSPVLQSDMLSIELFGLVFVLAGFSALLYTKRPSFKLALSAAFFLLASQVKETFTFSIIALLPYCLYLLTNSKFKVFIKIMLLSIIGPLLVILAISFYLFWAGGWEGYKQVLEYKLTRVQPFGDIGTVYAKTLFIEALFTENFLHWHDYIRKLIFLNLALVLIFKQFNTNLKIKIKKTVTFLFKFTFTPKFNWETTSSIFFSLGIFIGLIMYGQYSIDTRQIPVDAALIILIGILLNFPIKVIYSTLGKKLNIRIINILVFVLLGILLTPQTKIVKAFSNQLELYYTTVILGNKDSEKYYIRTSSTEINDYINKNTEVGDCILNPYGWEVAETYIYSGRKPCSRYFLANLVIQEDKQIGEYKKQIIKTPPKAILYNLNIIDLNVENFETRVINYQSVLDNCYTIDNNYRKYPYLISGSITYIDLYWRRLDLNNDQFMQCFRKHVEDKVKI